MSKETKERIEKVTLSEQLRKERGIVKELVGRISELEAENEAAGKLAGHHGRFEIQPRDGPGSEATAVIVASDWHIEEVVRAGTVNGLNRFDAKVCAERAERFFRHGLKLVEKERNAARIDTLVLALLGDFISGSIHEELMEGNRLLPVHAILEAQDYIEAGIRHILDGSDLSLVIPCHSGNHARLTRKVHISTEEGNSLERLMYGSLAHRFEGNPRVTFLISEGYHSYLRVYGTTLRFHHGHSVRYQGGIGGVTIPMNKAIAQWNRGKRADIDVVGHWHSYQDGGNFVVNGSLIGYNAFALSIKATPERPTQAFFLIDSRFGKTIACPIILTDDV